MACGRKHPLFLELLLLFFQEKRSSPRGNERDDVVFRIKYCDMKIYIMTDTYLTFNQTFSKFTHKKK